MLQGLTLGVAIVVLAVVAGALWVQLALALDRAIRRLQYERIRRRWGITVEEWHRDFPGHPIPSRWPAIDWAGRWTR